MRLDYANAMLVSVKWGVSWLSDMESVAWIFEVLLVIVGWGTSNGSLGNLFRANRLCHVCLK